jgi:hypothetical protein
MKWLVAAVALALAYLLWWPMPIDPVAWQPDPDPGLAGPHAATEELAPLALLEPPPLAWAVGLTTDGRVRYSLQTRAGDYRVVTSVNAFGDWLYLGSIEMSSVARRPMLTR